MHTAIVHVLGVRSHIRVCAHADQAIVEDVGTERVAGGYQQIDSEIKLEATDGKERQRVSYATSKGKA